MPTRFSHHGRCAFCFAGPQLLPVPGHEFGRFYCDEECRSYAGDVPHCSVAGCRGPADYTFVDYHRCNGCAPDGCRTCTAWGQQSCTIHRDRNARAALARGYRPTLKVLAGEHRAFDGRVHCTTCGGGGALDDGRVCQFCGGEGVIVVEGERPSNRNGGVEEDPTVPCGQVTQALEPIRDDEAVA